MSNSHFIKKEEVTRTTDLVGLNWRLFRSLPLFLKVLPLTIIAVLLASAAPSFFKWYAGKYSSSEEGFTLEGLIWVVVFATLTRISAWVLFEASGMWSSQALYARMIRGLARTRTTFFDENPSARVINRLIRDYDELRSSAIIFMGDFFNATIEVLSIGVVACIASPWAMVMIIPLLLIFFFIQNQRSTMIEHCRSLSAVANSHVLNRKNDLIEGREIFVLYGKATHLLERMTDSLRTYLQASLLTFQVEIWASFWMRFFAEFFSLCVLFFVISSLNQKHIDVPIAGVIISALFGVTGTIGWLDFATSLISRSAPHVRRVFEFIDLPAEGTEELTKEFHAKLNTKQRSPLLPPGTDPSPDLRIEPRTDPRTDPRTETIRGDITFKNYSMSYREGLPLILKDLNWVITEGSKTALVGRTGSGKSSIIQALLRMVHVNHGELLIGKQSVFELDIQKLRLQFGVVPQAPYLFEGTLASNLDRGKMKNAGQLQKALSAVGLHYSLDHPITEGGQNLSVGERQLICLARVIASDRSIILMDEPTSGLDPETDARINWILKTALKDKTVLTIAHRKESIRSYDSVIEMAHGRVV